MGNEWLSDLGGLLGGIGTIYGMSQLGRGPIGGRSGSSTW